MDEQAIIRKDWKFYAGITLLCYSFIPYLAAGAVALLRLPMAKILPIMGVLVISAEIAFALGAALLGKPFVKMIKVKTKGFFSRRPEVSPPLPISRVRHTIGVWLFFLSFMPYFFVEISMLFGYPKTLDGHLTLFFVLLFGNAIFMTGLFVLGSEFWGRLNKLFQWQVP